MKEVFANIALNIPVDSLFTYRIPPHLADSAEQGKRVLVSFGRKAMTGIIAEITDFTILKKVSDIKSIIDDERIISDELIQFCKWVSEYYIAPFGEVLFASIPRSINIKSDEYFFLAANYKEKYDELKGDNDLMTEIVNALEKNKNKGITKAQLERKFKFEDLSRLTNDLTQKGILSKEQLYSKPTSEKHSIIVSKNFSCDELSALIKKNKVTSLKQINTLKKLTETDNLELSFLRKETGITSSAINSLYKKSLINLKEVRIHRDYGDIFFENAKEIKPSDEQRNAISKIESAINAKQFKPFLLHGITGSGKTEVYINSIEHALKQGKSAIVLVPEISLTPQLIHRFRSRFPKQVGVMHSKISDGEKLDTLDRIRNGVYKIIIGARSAIFAPLRNIGIIIVDEEHDSSYKQESNPRYNGRDSAIFRAKLNNAVVVLGSATPSVESFYNAQTGKYDLLTLPSRVLNINLPEIKIVDLLKREKLEEDKKDFFDMIDKVRVKFLSKDLIYEIGSRLEKKESIIILQNRRGYHSYIECQSCGKVEMCVRCNIALTYHKALDLMKCHYCGYMKKLVKVCSGCGSTFIIPKGAGTERVEEELVRIFPKAVIKRMDSDTLSSKKLYHQILKDFYDKKIDILAGTQIISKGLDFPDVTLVGVVNADIGLLNPDFRSTEKTFQILTQVSGRAGRSEKKGEVLIQTNHSQFNVFENVRLHDYKNFYENEIKVRRTLNYPPFSRIAIIETKSEDLKLAEGKIKEIFNLLKHLDVENKLDILPPGQPLFSKLKDKFRYHILIKSGKKGDASGKYLNGVLRSVKDYANKNIPRKVMVIIDVDAMNFL